MEDEDGGRRRRRGGVGGAGTPGDRGGRDGRDADRDADEDRDLMMDDDDEMGDFIVDEGPGGRERARRRRQALASAIPGVRAEALEVGLCVCVALGWSMHVCFLRFLLGRHVPQWAAVGAWVLVGLGLG